MLAWWLNGEAEVVEMVAYLVDRGKQLYVVVSRRLIDRSDVHGVAIGSSW